MRRGYVNNLRYQPHTGIHEVMDLRPITAPELAALCRRTSWEILGWTSLAMVASVVLQVIVGA